MLGEYSAFPPEATTAAIQTGPGAAPMLKSGLAYTAKATAYATQSIEFTQAVARTSSVFTGESNMALLRSGTKGTMWLNVQATMAAKAATQSELQAAAHTTAFTSTPQLPDIARNHVTHAVLEATNFLGINGVPIAINEADYFIRMWGQAVSTMVGYETETMTNAAGLLNFTPAQSMGMPGGIVETLASSGFLAAAGLPAAIGRDAVMTAVGAETMFSLGSQQGGRLAATAEEAERKAQAMSTAAGFASQQAGTGGTEATGETGQQMMGQAMPMATQMAQQAGSQITELPSKAMQGPQSMAQQLMGPLQQMMSGTGGFGLDSTGTPVNQVGLLGASPFSNHPLTGGTGSAGGAGMFGASGLPGSGGTSARTPYMASLTAASAGSAGAVGEVSPTAAAARAGAAPVGAMPMGMAGHRGDGKDGSTIEGSDAAPQALQFDEFVDDIDNWGA